MILTVAARILSTIACAIAMLAFFYVFGGGWLVIPPSMLLGGH